MALRDESFDSAETLVAEMQAYYDRRAPVYDASMRYDRPEVVASLEPVFAALREQMRDRTVFEIACGPGFWTQRIAEVARIVHATDYNDSTLAIARAKGMDPTRVTFVRADAYELSAIDSPVEGWGGCFAVDWLAHVPKSRMHEFLRRLNDRMMPGARVAFCDQLPRATSMSGVYDAEGNHLQERDLPDGSRFRVIKHFLSDRDYHELFAPSGTAIAIQRFPEQRRLVASYTVGANAPAA